MGRRWLAGSLLAGLVAAGGCSSTRPTAWPGSAEKPGPIRDIDVRQDVGAFGRFREWVAGKKNALRDQNPIP
jgi:hypothetical protein